MKISLLGAGSWGFTLANLLAENGHLVVCWTTDEPLAHLLNTNRVHPRFLHHKAHPNICFTTSLEECLKNHEMIVESVTAAGIRPVFEKIQALSLPLSPIILTSKGIEQKTGYILSEVLIEILGEKVRSLIGTISGPSFATEVIQKLPTSVVGSSYSSETLQLIVDSFTNQVFRVYPNTDMKGVALGGALKNIIAIACGISKGLLYGHSAQAALMTRGLHEIRKLIESLGGRADTVFGLSGMGDLCLTCSSPMSRNFLFGQRVAEGLSIEEAKKEIGMVIEGAYTCISTLKIAKEKNISMPISEMVYQIIHDHVKPKEAVKLLMQRTIKEEHL